MLSSLYPSNGRPKTYGKKNKSIARQRNVGFKGSIELWDESNDTKSTSLDKELNEEIKNVNLDITILEDEILHTLNKDQTEQCNKSIAHTSQFHIEISKPIISRNKEHRKPLGPRPMNIQSNKNSKNGARQKNCVEDHENNGDDNVIIIQLSPKLNLQNGKQLPDMKELIEVDLSSLPPTKDIRIQEVENKSSTSSSNPFHTKSETISIEPSVCDTGNLLAEKLSQVDSASLNTDLDILISIADNLCLDVVSDHAADGIITKAANIDARSEKNSSDTLARISDVGESLATLRIAEPETTSLEILLQLCEQHIPKAFSEHVSGLLDRSYHLRKIGEASYSEVFEQYQPGLKGSTVLKIIPFGGEEDCAIEDIIQELRITKALSGLEGFIGFRGAHVVQGSYAPKLLDIWDDFDEIHTSENVRPYVYDETQLYCIIGLEHGGVTLENIVLGSWSQAAEIFQQVADTLAKGEAKFEFEHRDLHCGNLVISFDQVFDPDCSRDASAKNRDLPINAPFTVKLIDFTLSRAKLVHNKDDVVFLDLIDPVLFTAEGDYQFDMYRFMRDNARSSCKKKNGSRIQDNIDWSIYRPQTNVLWLHYLARRLLVQCGLTKPALKGKRKGSEQEIAFYHKMVAIEKAIDPRPKSTTGKSKTSKLVVPVHKCASEVAQAFRNLA